MLGGFAMEKSGGNKKNDVSSESNWKRDITVYIHDLICMLTVVLILFLLIFRVIVVSGPSMKMTLLDGDYLLLIGNLFYKQPQPGDIIVAGKRSFDNGKPIVKRVIATEGQIVDMDYDNGIVYVDGLPLEENYINTPTNANEGMSFPLIVEEGCVFVMGDNRNHSKDSRSPEIGLVDTREILGKVVLLIFPGTDGNSYPRDLSRIGAVK